MEPYKLRKKCMQGSSNVVILVKFSNYDASTYNVMQLCCLGDLSETSKVLLGALNDLLDFLNDLLEPLIGLHEPPSDLSEPPNDLF